MERKLAVILVADIVGYSAQMERDEAGTYSRVSIRRREIFEPEIARHKGRIFKLVGDGLLAEFGSAVQAVECAIALQASLTERNRDVSEDHRILARIGINLGEVIVEGVNIAARLEQLAEPGGICVSEKVAREVERELAFGFESMGERRVKNIAEPIHVYRVSAYAEQGPRRSSARPRQARPVWALAVALCLGVVAFAYFNLQSRVDPNQGPVSLGILRFANLTGDSERDYLTTSLPDVLSITLGSSSHLSFVEFSLEHPENASKQAFRTLAAQMQVQFLLDASFVSDTKGVTFDAQVIGGASGEVIESFSQAVADGDFSTLQYRLANDTLKVIAKRPADMSSDWSLDRDWARVSAGTNEYTYALRVWAANHSSAFSGPDEALRLISAGLDRYPHSVLLRIAAAERHSGKIYAVPEPEKWSHAQSAVALLSGLPEAQTLGLQ